MKWSRDRDDITWPPKVLCGSTVAYNPSDVLASCSLLANNSNSNQKFLYMVPIGLPISEYVPVSHSLFKTTCTEDSRQTANVDIKNRYDINVFEQLSCTISAAPVRLITIFYDDDGYSGLIGKCSIAVASVMMSDPDKIVVTSGTNIKRISYHWVQDVRLLLTARAMLHKRRMLSLPTSRLLQCESKNTPFGFLTFFPKRLGIFNQFFYTPIILSYLRQIVNFYSIISNFDEVMPY